MFADMNGATGYSEDKAALGTIKSDFYLKLPTGVVLPDRFTHNDEHPSSLTDEEVEAFFVVNYVALTRSGVNPDVATFLTLLRMNMVTSGFVAKSTNERAVYVDEYEYNVDIPDEPIQVTITSEVNKFVADYWENIVAVVAHVFRVRGHHYKDEYEDLYSRTWACTTIEVPTGIRMPSWKDISTIGLHCFGVKALHLVREAAFQGGYLAKGLEIRRNAACAGSAAVRTSAAALTEMRSNKWFSAFAEKFDVAIREILNQAVRLQNAGTRAHINAKLYDWNDRYMGIDETHVQTVAPYILGWIDTLDVREPITKQKAINKRAQGGSGIRTVFAAVILNELRSDRQYENVRAFLSSGQTENQE
jgi:hypothetical protein